MASNQIKVRTVNWDVFPAYSDRLTILECMKIGECVEDLPFNIPVSSRKCRIAVPSGTYLEFLKIKCYRDASRHIPSFVWQRVH